MEKGACFTYFFGTQKEIEDFYQANHSKEKYTLGAVSEVAGAYFLSTVFPLASIYLAADGAVRLVKHLVSKRQSGSPGLVGIIRENI